MQECVLVPHITCMFENMSKWRNHTFLFQKSPQVFQGEAQTLCKNQREQQQRWPGYSFRHQEKMWRIGPNQRDSWFSFGKAKTATTIQEISSTHAIITIFSHRTWAWDLTRHPDVRFGNIWSEKMEKFDSGNSQATMKELSDVSEM